jgi:hypothetical protein
MSIRNQVMGAAGFSSVTPNYIEDVFSSYNYTATGSAQTITNGIDLAGKGGLVWVKSRTNADVHTLQDTVRGTASVLVSNAQYASLPFTTNITSFNSNGFSIGTGSGTSTSGQNYASWTFRNQAKFFRCGTYTGNGAASQTITHTLGAAPGCIMVKNITTGGTDWFVFHKYAFDTGGLYGQFGYTNLNLPSSSNYVGTDLWAPTDTTFQVNGNNIGINNSGNVYAYYLFANNAGGFGLTGTENVITCGGFTTTTGMVDVNLGYEPQFVLFKDTVGSNNWFTIDSMRGLSVTDNTYLRPNSSGTEANFGVPVIVPTATGFKFDSSVLTGSGEIYIYIAIRRPMKVPTNGALVYDSSYGSSDVNVGFPADLAIVRNKNASANTYVVSRLTNRTLRSNLTDAESNLSSSFKFTQSGFYDGLYTSGEGMHWLFRRAPGFHDEVCYTGNGTLTPIAHNLTVPPELIFYKRRNAVQDWWVVDYTRDKYGKLNLTDAFANASTSPNYLVTSTTMVPYLNTSGIAYDAFLFASCPGVSKVGSYTGNGSSQTINCGFSAGARFVMVRRTDSAGNWMIWDTTRGINAANDPVLALNATWAEDNFSDDIDPASSGFIINNAGNSMNVSGATYLFLAIA